MSETSDCPLLSCLCVKKLIKNTTSESYCVRDCCQDTPKRAVHVQGGAVSINTSVFSRQSFSSESMGSDSGITSREGWCTTDAVNRKEMSVL